MEKFKNAQLILVRLFYFIFGFIFLALFTTIALQNHSYKFNELKIIFYVFSWLVATCYIYKKIFLYEKFISANESKIVPLILALLLCMQIYFGHFLAVSTSWDTEAVFRGAINLAENGNLGKYHEYLHIFPHNLGSTSALHFFFSLFSAKDIQDYYWIATIYNAVSINLGIAFTYLVCRELHSKKAAYLSLWLTISCLPLYFYTPIFYSDTLSLPFVMISFYFYLLTIKAKTPKEKIKKSLLFGAFCAIGSLIKFTVAIVAIAVLIDLLIRNEVRRHWIYATTATLVFFAITFSFNLYCEKKLLDEKKLAEKQVPYTHWVMMGLTGNGAYNGSEYNYTYSFPSLESRRQANLDKISDRLQEYGFLGYLEFLHKKQQVNFGSGIYGVNEMIDDSPLRPNYLHQFGIDTGKHYETFRHLSQGHHIFIFLIIIFGALYDAATKSRSATNLLAVRLSITGAFVFLAIWEANSRYILNFIPMFIACAALSFPDFYRLLSALKKSLSQHIQESRTLDKLADKC